MLTVDDVYVTLDTKQMIGSDEARLAQVVTNLDAWLETMRAVDGAGRAGYGGPVVHWWQNCLSYTGPGLDWRYEGVIAGYLTLWQRTGQQVWLRKAIRAGDDLTQGQRPSGSYMASSFELNPYSGGTPHEAAASLGLLYLAEALRQHDDDRWENYALAAERYLRGYALARLWDPAAQSVRDDPDVPSLVCNKACTLAEALFALAALQGDEELAERYALPNLDAVLTLQVGTHNGLADASRQRVGAIPQAKWRGEVVHQYFPFYIARCVPAMLEGYDYTGRQRYLDGAVAAMRFVAHQVDDDGWLPQVIYPRGVNRYPQWIAPLGDVLRAADLLEPYGTGTDLSALQGVLMKGQLLAGGLVTGRGFGAQVNQTYAEDGLPDFRDLIPVVGWVDKAFRYLASYVPESVPLPPAVTADTVAACEVRGQRATWMETENLMTLVSGGRTLYRWHKGQAWADVVEPEVVWK